MYNRILLAADGSDHSVRAAKEAVKLAALGRECKITLALVADFAKSKNEVLHFYGKEELDFARRKRLRAVEVVLRTHRTAYDIKILHGDPGPTIVDFANNEKFNMIVIGSRGLNSLQEMVLGSVSHKVVKQANCPVLIVK
ncbi:universal stress protein [Bacillus tuaregi]|uniref:universal stress protein n=1 Tax=Bacillus tuaregi TaxID=1816695 RepID=UPI0008F85253|nr:universal stress protein [Bacillus tuaregi]